MVRSKHYDVIVVGGGAAGIAAAIGARRAGKSVLLVERNGSLGGQATNANVASYCGFFTHGDQSKQIVYGVGQEVLEKLKALGYYHGCSLSPVKNAIVTLDVEATKVALDELAQEYELEFLLHCTMVEVEMEESGERILGIKCADDEGYCEFSADAFVDASGDGNLGAFAGAPFSFGDGNGGGYMSTRVMRIDHVDPDVRFAPALLEKTFIQAKRDGFTSLTKESGIVFRTHEDTVAAILPSVEVPALDAETLTRCEVDTRRQSQEYMEAFRKYFPGMEKARLVWTGSYFGIRDTRHLLGEYTLTGNDVLNAVKQKDAIAKGAWPCEMHIEKNKMPQYLFVKDDDYYEIPLRCLKTKKVKNLWSAGRVLSADHIAFASVRVMGTGFATGHAAGVAAALTGRDGIYDAQAIRAELNRQDAHI